MRLKSSISHTPQLIYIERKLFFQKWRPTPYSSINLQIFNGFSHKSLKVSCLDIVFYTHKWRSLLTKLNFAVAFEIVPFISTRSQQFSSLYLYFTLSQDILGANPQLAQGSSSTHLLVSCRCYSSWRPRAASWDGFLSHNCWPQRNHVESAMKAKPT